MIYLLFLVFNAVAACPESCKCEGEKAKCTVPEARDFPSLELPMKTTVLDLSGNNILNVPANLLKDLPNLLELILDGNKIYFLENGAFKRVPNLKKLSIQSNNLHFIEDEVFSDLTGLEELYLAKNYISSLPNLRLNKKLRKFCVSNNNIEALPENAFKNTTLLTALKLTRNRLTSLPRHVFPADVSGFAELSLVGNNLRDIPDVVKEMENLEKLFVCHNPIKVFRLDDFKPFKKLKQLAMTNIGLTEIANNTFNLHVLEKLYMGRNRISSESLSNLVLPQLKKLVLSGNPLKSLPENAFGRIPALEELDLSNCEISRVHQQSLVVLSELKRLNFNGNRLSDVPNLDHNTGLEHLDLSDNNIGNVSSEAFRTLRLIELSLSNNSLISLNGSSADFSQLNSIDLSYNQFGKFPRSIIATMPNLKSLNISFNNFSRVESTWFADLPKLRTLNLKGNRLTNLTANSLGSLDNLRELYLCKNHLTSLNSATFSRLPRLEVLTADKNKIEEIGEFSFSNNLNLTKISLNFNDLNRISKRAFHGLHKLKELWLLFNDLTEPPKLGDNTDLRVLGLCGNPLGNMPQYSLYGPKALEVLLLMNVGLTKFSSGILSNPEKLQFLKLADNNLTAIPPEVKQMKSLRKLVLTKNPIKALCWSNFVGLNYLRELRLDSMKLQSFAFSSLFQISSALRTLYLGSNPWHCGCDMEMFALGIDGKRANVVTQDRKMIVCSSPNRYEGKRIDYLRLADFKQCKSSYVKSISPTSTTITLPNIAAIALDHPEVHHYLSYQPLGGGKEKIVTFSSQRTTAIIDGLTPNTTYMVCIKLGHSKTRLTTSFKENILDGSETCHKVTTKDLNGVKDRPDSNKNGWSTDSLTTLYIVLAAVIGSALLAAAVSITVWCRSTVTIENEPPLDAEKEL